ncbi:hypothetical protein [Flagellimonas halotolerans]|uniref:Uncharacterized protein n=1 Tax=Flagellimonas halotolerans TaxID=3112164 RepID=A0ABU6ITQ1_9FLAO|nr:MULTISPECIES: hypothetical protein [unclassified Allomuricauda]MBA4745141.1 hypothetical protein [Allomuricauda sp.]MEC3966678.1 hypothetical protein [Muricauda sp. SYSU M86414]MEC4266516.1 hypothetical protein [Muricauda sp. SYSU M84420]
MMRTLAIPFISFVMVTILLTSPFVPLMGREYSIAFILGSSEEENNTHDTSSSKTFDIKYFMSKSFISADPSINQEKNNDALGYAFAVLEFTLETLDPPPRKLV